MILSCSWTNKTSQTHQGSIHGGQAWMFSATFSSLVFCKQLFRWENFQPAAETARIKRKAMVFPVFAAAKFIRLELQPQELEPFAVAFMSVQFSVRGRLSIPQTPAVSCKVIFSEWRLILRTLHLLICETFYDLLDIIEMKIVSRYKWTFQEGLFWLAYDRFFSGISYRPLIDSLA